MRNNASRFTSFFSIGSRLISKQSVPITHQPPVLDVAFFRQALAKLNRRLRAQDETAGIGSTGLSVLGRLYRHGPCTASELAAHERLQPQSLTRVLRELQTRKLIMRTVDGADRRRSQIALTTAGGESLRRAARSREAWLERAMAATLSDTEGELLRLAATLMERLADAPD
jgi:DNA-binding MarR family transcriptional regulator